MSCVGCKDGAGFDLPITMAFQPIVNVSTQTVFAYEALVRGKDGAGAGQVLAQIADHNRYAFDQVCRTTAIELAAGLDMAATGANLSINFLPNAVYEPRACIRATLAAAMRTGFPVNKIIFEFTESEAMDADHILNILRSYRAMGFKTAIDDFGAGYAGLGLLTLFQPDIVKLDMALIRDIDRDPARQAIVRGIVGIANALGCQPLAEGVETVEEFRFLHGLGIALFQGYLFGRPLLEQLGEVDPALWAKCLDG
jgi:EAL domain-containing protein (putative c-di-GMP-specific phosphodiesterase class I)